MKRSPFAKKAPMAFCKRIARLRAPDEDPVSEPRAHTAGQLELAPRHYCSAGDARHASTQSRHLAVFKTAVTGSSFFASLLANHTATRVYFEPYGTAATFHCPSGSNEEHLLRTIFTESTCRFWPSFNSSRGGSCSCDFKCIHEPAVAKWRRDRSTTCSELLVDASS